MKNRFEAAFLLLKQVQGATESRCVGVTPTPSADPLPGHLEEYRKTCAEFEAIPSGDEKANDAVFRRMRCIADKIISATPKTQEGVAAQLEVLMDDGMVDDLAAGQATDLLNRIKAALRAGLNANA